MEKDAHYYLKFALALQACCYDAAEAHVIASGDWGQDTNDTTVAGANSPNNTRWHALGTVEENRQRLEALKRRVERETDRRRRLVKLGQLLHFVEDVYAHDGYGKIIGHAVPTVTGRDVDSLARDVRATLGMIHASIEFLLFYCEPRANFEDRLRQSRDLFDEVVTDGLADDLVSGSDPAWKAPTGASGDRYREIIARNKLRIDRFVRDRIPAKAGTIPGFDENGLPDHLGIRYDANGEPTLIPEPLAAAPVPADGADVLLTVVDWKTRDGSLNVTFSLVNSGGAEAGPGLLTASTFDPGTALPMNTCSVPTPVIPAGGRVTGEVSVSLPATPAMVALRAHVADVNAHDNQAWLIIGGDSTALAAPASGMPKTAPPGNVGPDELGAILASVKLARDYVGRILAAASDTEQVSGALIDETVRALATSTGSAIGAQLAEDVLNRFFRDTSGTPFISETPVVRVGRRDGECVFVVTVFAQSSKGHPSRTLNRVEVRLGAGGGVDAVVGKSDGSPVWRHVPVNSRTTETAADIELRVPRSVCDLLRNNELVLDHVQVSVQEEVDNRFCGSTKMNTQRTFRISSATLLENLLECCT